MKTLAASLLLAGAATANAMTGNTLLSRITGSEMDLANAYGYIAGSGDALNGLGIVCMPDGVTVRQSTDIVKKWLIENPRRRHLGAGEIVAIALTDVWPCRSRRSS